MCFKSKFKADPIEFMRNNIVISPSENPGEGQLSVSKTVKLSITVHDYMTDASNNEQNVYEIAFEDSDDSIEAYWCPYIENNVGSVTLGTRAKWMFTPAMSGCSLGVGTRALDGTLLVSHANANRSGKAYSPQNESEIVLAMDQQRRIQRHLLAESDSTNNVINYMRYMGAEDNFDLSNRSTTFGEKPDEGGDWEFYTLMYTQKMLSVHRGIHKVNNDPVNDDNNNNNEVVDDDVL